jgi:hypothetical protein
MWLRHVAGLKLAAITAATWARSSATRTGK